MKQESRHFIDERFEWKAGFNCCKGNGDILLKIYLSILKPR